MHAFDIIAAGVTIIFILIGIYKGFIEEIFHLAAMVLGFVGAYLSYPYVYNKIDPLHKSSHVKTIVAFILAYIVIAFSFIIIGWILKKIVHLMLWGWIDRLLGGLIGFGKAALVIFIFVLSVTLLPPSHLKSSFTSSKTYTFMTKLPIKLKVPRSKNVKKYFSKLKSKRASINLQRSVKKLNDLKEKIDVKSRADST